jgi:hypothetical protein
MTKPGRARLLLNVLMTLIFGFLIFKFDSTTVHAATALCTYNGTTYYAENATKSGTVKNGTYYYFSDGFLYLGGTWYGPEDGGKKISQIAPSVKYIYCDASLVGDMTEFCSSLFELLKFEEGNLFDVQYVTCLDFFFQDDCSLIYVNLYDWTIVNVDSACSMFEECSSITDLDLSAWCGGITNVNSMFYNCTSLKYITFMDNGIFF